MLKLLIYRSAIELQSSRKHPQHAPPSLQPSLPPLLPQKWRPLKHQTSQNSNYYDARPQIRPIRQHGNYIYYLYSDRLQRSLNLRIKVLTHTLVHSHQLQTVWNHTACVVLTHTATFTLTVGTYQITTDRVATWSKNTFRLCPARSVAK